MAQGFLSGHFTGTSLEPDRIHHVNADVVVFVINIMSPDVYGTNETGASACITLSSRLLFLLLLLFLDRQSVQSLLFSFFFF